MNTKFLSWAMFAIALTFVVGCQPEEEEDDEEHDHSTHEHAAVTIMMEHVIGQQMLEFETMKYANSIGQTYDVQTLKYFISNFFLVNGDGDTVSVEGPFYIDAEDEMSTMITTGLEVEDGHWHMAGFTFGLDSTSNTTGRFTEHPEANMEWPTAMGGGYHYMKFEGAFQDTGSTLMNNFKMHSGPTMGVDYSFKSMSMIHHDVEDATDFTVTIRMDISQWLTDPTDWNFQEYVNGTMMDPDAQTIIKNNGGTAFSLQAAGTSHADHKH